MEHSQASCSNMSEVQGRGTGSGGKEGAGGLGEEGAKKRLVVMGCETISRTT